MVVKIQGHLSYVRFLQPPANPLYSRQPARLRCTASLLPDVKRYPGSQILHLNNSKLASRPQNSVQRSKTMHTHLASQTIACFLYGTRRFITVLKKYRHWTLFVSRTTMKITPITRIFHDLFNYSSSTAEDTKRRCRVIVNNEVGWKRPWLILIHCAWTNCVKPQSG
jgi:hypothetical protein